MKALGRLLLATALIVPAGFMTVQSAGATPANSATCTSNTGTLHFTPGLRLTDGSGQSIRNFTSGTVRNPTNAGRISGCTGIGIAGSTGGTFSFALSGGGQVTCSSIRKRSYAGTGQIKWDRPGSNAGRVTNLRLQMKFDSYTHVSFTGVVDSTYLHGTHLTGAATVPDKLKPVGVGGGQCQNAKRVKSLDYTNDGNTVL